MSLNPLLTPDTFQELIQNKEIGLGAFWTVIKAVPFEQQKDYIEKMDAWAWMRVIENQRTDCVLDRLLPDAVKLFTEYAPAPIQQEVVSSILNDYETFFQHIPIEAYMEELYKTENGRQILNQAGKDFSSKVWVPILSEPTLFILHDFLRKQYVYQENFILQMCELCGGYNKFSPKYWLHIAESYELCGNYGLKRMKDYCAKYHAWDIIAPETFVEWFENHNEDYPIYPVPERNITGIVDEYHGYGIGGRPFNPQIVSGIIAEWAENHGKTNKAHNVKGRNLASLYLASQGILEPLIEKQMIQVCNPTPDEAKRFPIMTTNEWLDKILVNPEYMVFAKQWDYGDTIRYAKRSFTEKLSVIGRSFRDRSMTFWTKDILKGRIHTKASQQKWVQVLITYPKLEKKVRVRLKYFGSQMWKKLLTNIPQPQSKKLYERWVST